ncbi:MAG: hypothetical protein J6A89_04440 [Clostridia bacterium]|nr:hypothetical protein [Clostridia bacterium]
MILFDKIKKEIEKKKYKVYEVNLALEVVKNGIQFENFEKLQNFMSDQNINTIFFSKYYDSYENYVITEETFRNARSYFDYNIIDIISDDIDKYNQEILKIDFNKPCSVVISCVFQGQYCFVCLEDDKSFDEDKLIGAEEKLYEIIEKNKMNIDKQENENKKIIENLKEEVREKILKDEKFLLCTTKQLRKNYTRTLFKEKLGNHYKLLKDIWTTDAPVGVYTDAIDFVEMIWKEIKQN